MCAAAAASDNCWEAETHPSEAARFSLCAAALFSLTGLNWRLFSLAAVSRPRFGEGVAVAAAAAAGEDDATAPDRLRLLLVVCETASSSKSTAEDFFK